MSLIKEYIEKTEPVEIPGRDVQVPPMLRQGPGGSSRPGKMLVPAAALAVVLMVSGYLAMSFFQSWHGAASPGAVLPAATPSPIESPNAEASNAEAFPNVEAAPKQVEVPRKPRTAKAIPSPRPNTPAMETPKQDAGALALANRIKTMETAAAKAALVMEKQAKQLKAQAELIKGRQGMPEAAPARENPVSPPLKQNAPDAGPRAFFTLGVAAQKSGDLRLAMAFYRKCLVIDPLYPKALVNLATIHMARGNNDRAIQVFEKLYQSDPDNLDVLVNLGILKMQKGEFDQSESLFNQAITLHGDHPKALFNLAFLYQKTGRPKEAVREYIRTVSVDRENYKACLGAAGGLEKQKKYRDAVAFYEKALDIPEVKKNSSLQKKIKSRIRLLQRAGLNMAQK